LKDILLSKDQDLIVEFNKYTKTSKFLVL